MASPRFAQVFGAWLLAMVSATPALAELHPRLDGAAAYDDVLNVTWLTDAGLSPDDSWENQLAWVESLNQANYLGFNDWRLASMSVAAGLPVGTTESVLDCSTVWGPLCADNELSYMYYYNLGAQTGSDLTGDQAVGDVTLTNIQPVYWSGTEYAAPSGWIIHFTTGFGVWSPKGGNRHAWAVRAGDVGGATTGGSSPSAARVPMTNAIARGVLVAAILVIGAIAIRAARGRADNY
ncbi:MAG: DUF1566 domain-containing protein [Gammaproteobacteria bacterium]|nr:DUF1566 domain-containing protein [Gammaproteobacteria bacterium]NNM01390.1 DUF1566 domain-containing protein [Gammaproteobacteria bacterium]